MCLRLYKSFGETFICIDNVTYIMKKLQNMIRSCNNFNSIRSVLYEFENRLNHIRKSDAKIISELIIDNKRLSRRIDLIECSLLYKTGNPFEPNIDKCNPFKQPGKNKYTITSGVKRVFDNY